MTKKWVLILSAFLIVLGVFLTIRFFSQIQKSNQDLKKNSTQNEMSFYYTCPMHPHIHMDHPGKCPICGMDLVIVNDQIKQVPPSEPKRPVQVSNEQLRHIGLEKQKVEKMSLTIEIPISGRFISTNSISFQIYERDLNLIHPGLRFHGQSAFNPNFDISGIISSVDSIVDPTSRTVRVIGRLEKSMANLRSESTFRGVIEAELKNVIAISEDSILRTGSEDIVYVFGEGSHLLPKSVKLGAKAKGYYEILNGLNEGEFISSGPNFFVDSEAKIRGTR